MPVFRNPEDAPTELQRLLLRAVPENKFGNKTIDFLAELIPVNRWSVRKWITNDRIPPERVLRIVEISKITGFTKKGKPIVGSEARVTRQEFDPFVYNF